MALITNAMAAVDFTQFELKPHQLQLLKKLEAKGKSEEYLIKMAKGFHLYNTTGSSTPPQETEYIPPHTREDLENVIQWAKGGALSAFLNFTPFDFDYENYKSDCPSWALFNFGRATGTEHLDLDVLDGAIRLSTELQFRLNEGLDEFPGKFLEIAEREGFLKYLIQ